MKRLQKKNMILLTRLNNLAGIKWSNKENLILKKYYSDIIGFDKTGLLPNRTHNAINIQARKLGLNKKLSAFHRYGNLQKLLDESLEAYYWIGFILADGSFNHETYRLAFQLANKDKIYVKNLAKFLEFKTPITNRISVQDKNTIPKILEKFDFKHYKTCNPPEKKFELNDMLIALYIGFIDGDGCIKKQYKRKDAVLTIKLHATWIKFLEQMEENLYKYFNVIPYRNKSRCSINNNGYAKLNITDSNLLKKLKQFTINSKLPIMTRKWDNIDINYTSRYIEANKIRQKALKMLKYESNLSKVAKKLNCTYGRLYSLVKRNGGTYV